MTKIRNIAEQIDQHRKARQAEHPRLTLTSMYNVMATIRAGDDLTAGKAVISEQGEIESPFRLHNGLDAAVADAYGWPVDLSDEEILQRLFDLNQERAREEDAGIIRWVGSE